MTAAERELRLDNRERRLMAGKVVHFEVPAGDTGRSREFWTSLFGWQWQAFEGPTEYHMTQVDDSTGGAVYPDDDRGIRVYFDVDEINAGAAKVRELGGEADEPMPVPGMGWFTACNDTEGNKFGLWQTDPNAQPPSQ
jgi:uncharacterized protein